VPRTHQAAYARVAALPPAGTQALPGGQSGRGATDQPDGQGRWRGAQYLPASRTRSHGCMSTDQRSAPIAVPGPGDNGRRIDRGQPARMLRELIVEERCFPLAAPFRISRGVKHNADVVTVALWQAGR